MRVSGLFVYPIKAVRAVPLTEAAVEPRGLAGDRRWLIVDEEDVFVTQRDHPVLATVTAELLPEGLRLRRDGMADHEVSPPPSPLPATRGIRGEGEPEPLTPQPPLPAIHRGEGEKRTVTIWRNQVDALDAGDGAAEWVSLALDFPARLVFMGPDSRRPVDPDYGQAGDEVSFADGFPLLITNEASLDDLNAQLASPVPMNRFRPNLVVSGALAWGEDDWKLLRIGEVEFRNVKKCGRCLVTTTDQTTGQRMGDEPLRTLATFRNFDGKAMFGSNLIPSGTGTIRVGDAVEVIA